METAKVSTKYQIVVPKKVREAMGIKKEDILLFKIEDNGVKLEKFDELLKKHVGTVKLKKEFKVLRREFNEEMAQEVVK